MEFVEEARAPVQHDRMLTFELEAAEALADLAGFSAFRGQGERPPSQQILAESQDRAMGVQQFFGNTSATTAGSSNNTENVEVALGRTCCTSGRPKVCRTVRKNLSEAEKEAQRLSRVLANRESARRTIRRRQTMYLELTAKVANLSEENMNLKKGKELVLKKYNSLKGKNEFLKAEMAKRKIAEAGERQVDQLNSSRAEISTNTTATPPIFLYNHPSWPSIVPSSDIFNLQYIPNPDGTILTWEKPCSNQGQKGPGGINAKPETPLFLLAVPWLLPFLTQFSSHEFIPGSSQKNETAHIHHCHTCSSSVAYIQEDNHLLSSNRNMRADDSRHGFLDKNRGRPLMSPPRKLGDVMATSDARIKRKELMRLNNRHGHNSHAQ